jgi:hypothetical protein
MVTGGWRERCGWQVHTATAALLTLPSLRWAPWCVSAGWVENGVEVAARRVALHPAPAASETPLTQGCGLLLDCCYRVPVLNSVLHRLKSWSLAMRLWTSRLLERTRLAP